MTATKPQRRRHPRVALAGPIVARLLGGREGWVRDLSAGGARLEHEGILRPGQSCPLEFALNDNPFTFSGRVVWSRAGGPESGGRGQSGVAFERIPGAAKPLLAQLLDAGAVPRVLIVEDERSVREVLTAALARAGYEVHEAADGVQALAAAEWIRPDVILLDVHLPGVDGFQVCRELKANPATQSIPVIFVTAVADRALHARATAAGAIACITKPFRLEALVALTQTVIRGARR